MSSENFRIIEINGVKLEVDLRNAKRIDNFRVGSNVKVLTKKYDGGFEVSAGVIVGFDEFQKLPTIIVATLEVSYSAASIKFHYVNAQSKDLELCLAGENDVPFERERVIELLNREITKKENEVIEAQNKLNLFNRQFGHWFEKQKEAVNG